MRLGVVFLLLILWLLSGDGGPDTDYLKQRLQEIQDEYNIARNNVTFGVNDTYPLPEVVSARYTELFNTLDKDPRSHYYQNVTGSFKGEWIYDEEAVIEVNDQFPLPNAPKNETAANGGPKEENNSNTSKEEGGESSMESPFLEEGDMDEYTDEEKELDTIKDKKAHYLEDIDNFRGSFEFNRSGTFVFNLKETKVTENINWVKGSWRLRHEDNEDNGISLNVQGVHFVHNGSFYMWGIPEGRPMPLWHVLELMPSNDTFLLARAALEEHNQRRIHAIENILQNNGHLEYDEGTLSEETDCYFQMYMQLGAISPSVRSSALKDLEREWAAPQGISTIDAPHLNSTLFMYSPNCRVALRVKKSEGTKVEKFYSKAINYAGMAGTLAFIQVFLFVRQMEYTPTPSSVSKVSYWCIALQVLMDAYLCMVHLTTSVLVDSLFIPFVAASYFSFVLVAIFGMRYMLVIWRIQRPERRRMRDQAAAASAANAASTANTTSTTNSINTTSATSNNENTVETMPGGLPLPVTAARPTQNNNSDSPRSDIQAIYGRFYWMLIVSMILLYEIAISSTRVRNWMIAISALCMYSFWIPQIVRNVTRGSKRGLNHWFLLGMSITRLAQPVYFFACPENLMGNEPAPWVWVLVLWVALQVGILLLQDWLGPRFFVPKEYLPPVYDYHPILPTGDEESGRTAPSSHAHHDCAICLLPIDTASQTGGATRLSSVVGSLGRLNYMLTPCGHLFHTDCLERWMRIKLECPHCRQYLPFI